MKNTDPMSPTPENSPQLRRHYMKLQSLRIALLEVQNGRSTNGAGPVEGDGGCMIDTINNGSISSPSLGILSLEQNALTELNAACQRVLDGTYGICEITGKPIPESLLRTAPWTRYRREVTERLKQRHLADRPDSSSSPSNQSHHNSNHRQS